MAVVDLFKVSMFTDKLYLDPKPMIKKIKQLQKKNPKGTIKSNKGGWQCFLSHDFNPQLINILNANAHVFAKHLSLKTPMKLGNIWVNINKKNDYNVVHVHPGSQLSGVFYLQVPEKSGNITFLNPVGKMLDYDWGTESVTDFTSYTSSRWSVVSTALQFYLFPSWLSHYVEPSENNTKERISISFNFKYTQ